jgi:hypothetical protein
MYEFHICLKIMESLDEIFINHGIKILAQISVSGHSSQLKKTQKKSSPPNIENLYDQSMKTRAYCVFV